MCDKTYVVVGNILNRRHLRDTKKLSTKKVILADQCDVDMRDHKIILCVNANHCEENNVNVDDLVAALSVNNQVINTVNMF